MCVGTGPVPVRTSNPKRSVVSSQWSVVSPRPSPPIVARRRFADHAEGADGGAMSPRSVKDTRRKKVVAQAVSGQWIEQMTM